MLTIQHLILYIIHICNNITSILYCKLMQDTISIYCISWISAHLPDILVLCDLLVYVPVRFDWWSHWRAGRFGWPVFWVPLDGRVFGHSSFWSLCPLVGLGYQYIMTFNPNHGLRDSACLARSVSSCLVIVNIFSQILFFH